MTGRSNLLPITDPVATGNMIDPSAIRRLSQRVGFDEGLGQRPAVYGPGDVRPLEALCVTPKRCFQCHLENPGNPAYDAIRYFEQRGEQTRALEIRQVWQDTLVNYDVVEPASLPTRQRVPGGSPHHSWKNSSGQIIENDLSDESVRVASHDRVVIVLAGHRLSLRLPVGDRRKAARPPGGKLFPEECTTSLLTATRILSGP